MRQHTSIIIGLFITASAILSCGSQSDKVVAADTKQEIAAQKDDHENDNTVTLTDDQAQSIGLTLGSVEDKQLTATLKANGTLKVPNQNRATVNSIYGGVIKSLLVQPGNFVTKGQVIASVANPQFIEAQSQYLTVNAEIGLAELEVKRQKELNAGNAGALKNLQAAETKLRTLRTAKFAYAQQIQLMGVNPASLSNGKLVSILSVRSPISGVVSDVKVQMGSYVDVSTVIAEIVDNSQLHLDLFVYEKDMPKLKNNQDIHFTLTNNPGKEYDAQIYSLGSSFEGESKAVSVHAKVRGDKTGLIDGMSITAVISLEKETKPAVPTDAIVNVAGQDYIFMLTEKHAASEHAGEGKDSIAPIAKAQHGHKAGDGNGMTFERVPVSKGTTDVGYTEVIFLNPIPKDAKIVVKGAFFVLAKMINVGGHGH